jgi:enoyl-CoA hydratase
MTRLLNVDTDDFRVELGEDGIAEVILGTEGTMPTTGVSGHREMSRIWPRLSSEPGIRSVLVRSVGRGFCAGGHTALVAEMIDSRSVRLRVMREAREIVQGMIDCDLPIVSAIHGAAVGAGAAVALLADVSIAARSARIIDGHTKIGVAAGDHAAVIWPLLCGMAKAKYYLMTCAPLSGEEAERIGLVSLAVPDDELQTTARRVAAELAAGSPTAIAFTKRSLNHWLRAAWPAFEHSLALEMMGFGEDDCREGLQAVNDKRKPRFASGA